MTIVDRSLAMAFGLDFLSLDGVFCLQIPTDLAQHWSDDFDAGCGTDFKMSWRSQNSETFRRVKGYPR
jgi:hypothetical protein